MENRKFWARQSASGHGHKTKPFDIQKGLIQVHHLHRETTESHPTPLSCPAAVRQMPWSWALGWPHFSRLSRGADKQTYFAFDCTQSNKMRWKENVKSLMSCLRVVDQCQVVYFCTHRFPCYVWAWNEDVHIRLHLCLFLKPLCWNISSCLSWQHVRSGFKLKLVVDSHFRTTVTPGLFNRFHHQLKD